MFKHHDFDPRRDSRHDDAHGRHRAHFARFGQGRHGGPFGRGFGGGRDRLFDGGDLQLTILQLLADKPSYGYELIKAIETRFGGGYAPSPGVVYPTLTLLEERGFAEIVSTDGNRKVYGITEAGRGELTTNAERLQGLTDRFQEGRRGFGDDRSPKVRSALKDLHRAILRRALRARETGEGLPQEQLDKIVAAILGAASTIDSL